MVDLQNRSCYSPVSLRGIGEGIFFKGYGGDGPPANHQKVPATAKKTENVSPRIFRKCRAIAQHQKFHFAARKLRLQLFRRCDTCPGHDFGELIRRNCGCVCAGETRLAKNDDWRVTLPPQARPETEHYRCTKHEPKHLCLHLVRLIGKLSRRSCLYHHSFRREHPLNRFYSEFGLCMASSSAGAPGPVPWSDIALCGLTSILKVRGSFYGQH